MKITSIATIIDFVILIYQLDAVYELSMVALDL